MNNKKIGILIAITGLAILVFSLAIDDLGIGSPGFGITQILGVIVGAVTMMYGAMRSSKV